MKQRSTRNEHLETRRKGGSGGIVIILCNKPLNNLEFLRYLRSSVFQGVFRPMYNVQGLATDH
jgi:hypothetical protein